MSWQVGKILLYSVCCIVFIIQLMFISYSFLWPESTNTEYYETELKEMEFPVNFRLCPTIGYDQNKLMNFGYKSVGNYFYGQSPYNSSVYGWTGHQQIKGNVTSGERKHY